MKLKYFVLLLLSLYIVNCAFYIDAQATIRYVSKTGTSTPPYTSWQTAADSIQKCINICVDGDTIYVANGIYKENLVINTAISLIGSSMDSTVIDGRGMSEYTISYNTSSSLENFNIYGKDANDLSSRVLRSNIMNSKIKIEYCRIGNGGVGVSMVNGDVYAYNVLLTNLTRGFNLFGDSLNKIDHCVIFLEKPNAYGLNMGFAPNVVNEINKTIILFNGLNNPESGISIGAVKRVYIYNNLISGFRPNIYFDTIVDTSFVINSISGFSNYAFGSVYLRNILMQVQNNIFKKNVAGLRVFGDPNDSYNLYWENRININGGSLNDSDLVADPMFIKDTIPTPDGNYDFHLQAFSPGIDKGDPSILDRDGTRSDIGMYGGPFGETYTYQDLAPLTPRNLSAIVDSNYITVRWNRNTEADTSYYKVYRDTVINFTIDSTKLISSSADTFYVQPNPHNVSRYVYRITCVDNQGNESLPSNELVVNITSVSTDDYPQLTTNYLLYQNYPNPFNPSTKIGYQLKQRAYVKLMVYDIKGELVSLLVNKEQNAGYYEVEFSSSSIQNPESSIRNLASGIYLYRIEVIGEGKIPVYTEMKKMLLIK